MFSYTQYLCSKFMPNTSLKHFFSTLLFISYGIPSIYCFFEINPLNMSNEFPSGCNS